MTFMQARCRRVWRGLEYLAIPALGAVSPLIAIPAITATAGASGWAAIAIGQGVGSAAAVVVELAWGLTGPQRVSRLKGAERGDLYLLALLSKILVFAIVAPFSFYISTLICDDAFSNEAGWAALSACAVGLSGAWFFLGTGRPAKILTIETLPRLVATLGSCLILINVGSGILWIYPVALLIVCVVSPVCMAWIVGNPSRSSIPSLSRIVGAMQEQKKGLAARVISSVYLALPVPLVALVAPSIVPEFAAVERLMRLVLVFLQAVPNALQKRVGLTDLGLKDSRGAILRVIFVNGLLGLASGLAFIAFGRFLTEILFAGTLEPEFGAYILSGSVISVVCLSRATGGLVLVRLNALNGLLWSALLGSVLGVLMLVLLAPRFGVSGAFAGELLAEVSVLLFQGVVLFANPFFRRKRYGGFWKNWRADQYRRTA